MSVRKSGFLHRACRWKTGILSMSAALAVAACGSDDEHHHHGADSGHDCSMDTRGETYMPAMQKSGEGGYTIALLDAVPAPPAKGDNVWQMQVEDDTGDAAEGMSIRIRTWMPDHQHGSPIVPTITDEGGGVYSVDPVNLFMGGYWEVDVTAIDPGETEASDDDVDLDMVQFRFCIDS